MAAGGPANAIGVCSVAAPKIAADKSAAKQMATGRTSLKLRQPNNKPDAWEMQQLLRFEERKAAGENPATIEFAEYVETGGQRVFRYMKAIPTAELCLACHGGTLVPEVTAKLKELSAGCRDRLQGRGPARCLHHPAGSLNAREGASPLHDARVLRANLARLESGGFPTLCQ